MTIQVAPDDCTGCGVCVEICPAKSKEEVQAQGDRHGAEGRAPRARSAPRFDFFLDLPPIDRTTVEVATVKGSQMLRAAVRVLGRLRGLRRDAVPEAADPALRRPDAGRQRDRLLVDLRRQPADDAVVGERRRAAGRPGRTRCSRTTPSSASACGSRSTPRPSRRARLVGEVVARPRARPARGRRRSATRRGSPPSASASPSSRRGSAAIDSPEARRLARARRRARPQERLDRRRRRLGLRHRLRRPRPRARLGPRRQRAGARHRGLLEHRRPGLEGDAARRGREVRRRRQGDGEEGPRHDRRRPTATSTSRRSRWAPTTRRR